ncbi:hypothetical protein LINGRAHAP2_LOCUS17045 [Linum grandiflorum]
MNRCTNSASFAMGAAAYEELNETVVCPKPRRLGALNPSLHSFRFHPSSPPLSRSQLEVDDSRAGAELLDLILSKRGCNLPPSPPFYCGSPPSRATNPVIEDAEFGTKNRAALGFPPPSPSATAALSSSPLSPSARGCVRLGQKPAVVRIEGFDCLGRDGRQSCRISAVA